MVEFEGVAFMVAFGWDLVGQGLCYRKFGSALSPAQRRSGTAEACQTPGASEDAPCAHQSQSPGPFLIYKTPFPA